MEKGSKGIFESDSSRSSRTKEAVQFVLRINLETLVPHKLPFPLSLLMLYPLGQKEKKKRSAMSFSGKSKEMRRVTFNISTPVPPKLSSCPTTQTHVEYRVNTHPTSVTVPDDKGFRADVWPNVFYRGFSPTDLQSMGDRGLWSFVRWSLPSLATDYYTQRPA